jgi:5'-nucleotidase
VKNECAEVLGMMETIHIYHTNDIHSHFEHWVRITPFLKEQQALHQKMGQSVFVFDIGDHVDRWHPYTEGTLGKGNVELLNDVGYTAVTIGNNEGITFGYEDLDSLYDNAQFDVVVANVYQPDHKRPKWAKPYCLYQTKHGLTLGVIGVTAYFKRFYELLGWKMTDPIEEVKRIVARIREHADIIVLLSHLGIYDDERMAREIEGIDVILGGHTHHILHEGKVINNVLLAAGGKHGQYVGHVQLTIDTNKVIHEKKAQLYETQQLPPREYEDEQIDSLFEKGKTLLYQPIAHVKEELAVHWFQPSTFPQLLCDAILEWCQGDCAFINAGLVLHSLPKGKVTKFHIHQALPHPINPCVVELTGAELKEVFRQSFDQSLAHLPIKGFGFRGQVMGAFVYSGIDFDENRQTFSIRGKPLEARRVYQLATIDMFTFGPFFPEIHRAQKKTYFLPEFLRDIIVWKLSK